MDLAEPLIFTVKLNHSFALKQVYFCKRCLVKMCTIPDEVRNNWFRGNPQNYRTNWF